MLLHGVILSAPQRLVEDPLFLWLEPAERGRSAATAGRSHPYALPGRRVERELKDRFGFTLLCYACTQSLLLPSDAAGPSLWRAAPQEPLPLREWTVSGVRVHQRDLPRFLARLAELGDEADGLRLAPDLMAIARFAAWVLRQVTNGQVVPDAEYDPFDMCARWRLADHPALARALDNFATHFPMAALAAVEHVEEMLSGFAAHVRRGALAAFADTLADAAVRERVRRRRVELADERTGGRLVVRWMHALLSLDPNFRASPPAAQKFVDAVKGWHHDGARAAAGARTPRLVLQLEPVLRDEEERRYLGITREPGRVRVPSSWSLRYALYDPERWPGPLPAEELWRRGTDVDTLVLQAQLQALIAQAGRIFKPLLRALAHEPPESRLSSDEAAVFLTRASDRLHAAGVIIQLPAWLDRPPAPVRYRVVVEPSAGRFSADTLVTYEWRVAVGDSDLDPDEFWELYEGALPFVHLDGEWIALHPDHVRRLVDVACKDRTTAAALDVAAESLAWEDDVEVEVRGDHAAEVRRLLEALGKERRWELLDPPAGLRAELRPYQQRGFSWLAFMREYRLGACLADDMGLGKTVQVIALLQHVVEREGARPALVVCPTSVIENWRRELQRFAPGLRVYVHHGPGRPQGDLLRARIEQADVVVTSYGLVLRDCDVLQSVAWDTVVADEAQNLKNPLAKQTRSLKGLTAAHRIALTGTPIENRLLELWSIFDFIQPGYLGTLTAFRQKVETPVVRYDDEEVRAWLRRRIAPFILRRTKADPGIAPELPEKLESKVYCRLTPEQAALYQAVVDQMLQRIEAAEGMKRRGLVLASLTRLKQICDHPALFHKEERCDPARSGKLQRLIELLRDVRAAGESALIFTQYAQMGRLLQRTLQEALGEDVLFLHGGVPRPQRDELVRRFQAGLAPVFILSLRAGGVGLNLTRATHVFHFDRWWNPAVETQATDRAYRIGQAQRVNVYKFICSGTLEDHIDQLIDEKRALAQGVIEAGETWLSELSNEALREIVTLRSEVLSS